MGLTTDTAEVHGGKSQRHQTITQITFYAHCSGLIPPPHPQSRQPWPKSPPTPTAVAQIPSYTHCRARQWPK